MNRNTILIPHHQQRHTIWAILYGAVLLMWLSTENATMVVVALLGVGLSLMLVLLGLVRWFGGREASLLPALILLGGLIGFMSVWTVIGLMVFKNAWHSHAYPDFAAVLVEGMFHRLISWTIAGAILGGAASLLYLYKTSASFE